MKAKRKPIYNTKVAVVGGAGFIGSHLVDFLVDTRMCQVLVLDNLITGRREFINPKAHFHHVDITKSETYLHRLFREYDIQYVFNYAAEPYIPVSFERPLHVFDINAMGAMHVINAAHEAGVQGILQVSSAEIYGKGQRGTYEAQNAEEWGVDLACPIDESAPVCPHSSYGAAKAAIDAMVQVRWKEAQCPAIALRQFNCLGPRETHPYVIPEIMRQVVHNEDHNGKIRIKLGNDSRRDFQWVGDAVRNAVLLLEKGDFGEVYNMGSQTTIGIYELALKIAELIRPEVEAEVVRDEARVRPWEIWHLQSDNTKLNRVIGEQEVMGLNEALMHTFKHYEQNEFEWSWEIG